MTLKSQNTHRAAVEEINPYDGASAKTGQVERMFDSIAPAYDAMNLLMSFGQCTRWRNRALKMLAPKPGAALLDIATGTGDLAFALYRHFSPDKVVGLDLSEGMLAIAADKLAKMDADARRRISFVAGDCLALPFADNSFDYITVAYGVRNFEHLHDGLCEMHRVLRPGGKLCVIELSQPRQAPLRALWSLYSKTLIPLAGRLISGDSRAYSYLPESIAACPQRDDMTALMRGAGFVDTTWQSLTFGAVTIYLAEKNCE